MYPFGNFKFKNVKDNTLYTYEPLATSQTSQPIENVPIASDAITEPTSTVWNGASQENTENFNVAFLAKTFTPSQSNENIEEFDFDLGFLDNIANDEPLKLQTTVSTNNTCGQPDDDGIDDFLNDLIHGNGDSNQTVADTIATTVRTENNNQIEFDQFNFVEPRAQPMQPLTPLALAAIPTPPSTASPLPATVQNKGDSVQLTKAKRKLSKCLESIAMKAEKREKKPKQTKNPVPKKKAIAIAVEESSASPDEPTKLGEVTKVYSRSIVSTKRLPSFESTATEMNVEQKLLTLVQQQDIHKPLDLLQRLKSLDIKRVNAPLVRKITAKSNAMPAPPPQNVQKEIVCNVVSLVKSESNALPFVTNVRADSCNPSERPIEPFANRRYVGQRELPDGSPDLATFFGYNNFGNISYETDENAFGQQLDIDQIVEGEVEIIPVEVSEDGSIFGLHPNIMSEVVEVDLFGCSSFATVMDDAPVADTNPSASIVAVAGVAVQREEPTVVVQQEKPAEVVAAKAPKKKRAPPKKKELVANATADMPIEPLLDGAVVPAKSPHVKRPRKKKSQILENGDGHDAANVMDESATKILATPKAVRKPKKKKAVVSTETSDENLAGFSLNELNESVANAAQKKVKKPRKRPVKVDASETSLTISDAVEIGPESAAPPKAAKKPRKRPVKTVPLEMTINVSSSTDISDCVGHSRESTVVAKAVKKPRKRPIKVIPLATLLDADAPNTSAIPDSVETDPGSTAPVTKAVKKPRKKKAPAVETTTAPAAETATEHMSAPLSTVKAPRKTVKRPRKNSKTATPDTTNESLTMIDATLESEAVAVEKKVSVKKPRKRKLPADSVETEPFAEKPPKKSRKKKTTETALDVMVMTMPSQDDAKSHNVDVIIAAESSCGISVVASGAPSTESTKSI